MCDVVRFLAFKLCGWDLNGVSIMLARLVALLPTMALNAMLHSWQGVLKAAWLQVLHGTT
jgi:hypothetical protein